MGGKTQLSNSRAPSNNRHDSVPTIYVPPGVYAAPSRVSSRCAARRAIRALNYEGQSATFLPRPPKRNGRHSRMRTRKHMRLRIFLL